MTRRAFPFLALCAAAHLAAADAPSPEPGETLLASEQVDKVLAELSAFKEARSIKGRIVAEVDDVLGKRKLEGELFLDRPARVLRKFTTPSLKVWLLSGAQLQEYAAKKNTLYVKDFSKDPKSLKLVQAAGTADIKALRELFDVSVFVRAGRDSATAYRFVLAKKAGDTSALYRRIVARIYEGALFFHEIEYLPDTGDRTVEYYRDLQATKFSDADFALDLPADVVRKTEVIGEGQ